jgi:hypothetical protein
MLSRRRQLNSLVGIRRVGTDCHDRFPNRIAPDGIVSEATDAAPDRRVRHGSRWPSIRRVPSCSPRSPTHSSPGVTRSLASSSLSCSIVFSRSRAGGRLVRSGQRMSSRSIQPSSGSALAPSQLIEIERGDAFARRREAVQSVVSETARPTDDTPLLTTFIQLARTAPELVTFPLPANDRPCLPVFSTRMRGCGGVLPKNLLFHGATSSVRSGERAITAPRSVPSAPITVHERIHVLLASESGANGSYGRARRRS